MFKRILVAIDGSAASNAGFKSAVQLAKDQHASLVGLHVIDDAAMAINVAGGYLSPSYVDTLYDSLRENGRSILARAQAAAGAAGVEIKPVLAEGRGKTVAHTILQEVRKSKADLVVIGTHGRRGISRIVMGSDAEAVVREAGVPVLLVRSPEHAERRKSTSPRDRATLARASGTATTVNAKKLRRPVV